jgi:uncharacterized protein (TIGR02444 family)
MSGAAGAEGFWRFSLMVYARPGVADALIGLQDQCGRNVNLVLFGLWLGFCEGRWLNQASLKRAQAAMAPLDREVVTPLRRLRRQLKGNSDPDVAAMRTRMLGLELAAERRVQARLAASLWRSSRLASGERGVIAEANLRLILGADGDAPEATALRRALAWLFES